MRRTGGRHSQALPSGLRVYRECKTAENLLTVCIVLTNSQAVKDKTGSNCVVVLTQDLGCGGSRLTCFLAPIPAWGTFSPCRQSCVAPGGPCCREHASGLGGPAGAQGEEGAGPFGKRQCGSEHGLSRSGFWKSSRTSKMFRKVLFCTELFGTTCCPVRQPVRLCAERREFR